MVLVWNIVVIPILVCLSGVVVFLRHFVYNSDEASSKNYG